MRRSFAQSETTKSTRKRTTVSLRVANVQAAAATKKEKAIREKLCFVLKVLDGGRKKNRVQGFYFTTTIMAPIPALFPDSLQGICVEYVLQSIIRLVT
jgi:hypothetical protein